MRGPCTMFIRAQSLGVADGTRLQRHLTVCTSCRDQANADAHLRAHLPGPSILSAGFTSRCMARVRAERTRGVSSQAFWLGAPVLAVSVFAVRQIPWTTLEGEPATWVAVWLTALALGWPATAFGGILRPLRSIGTRR